MRAHLHAQPPRSLRDPRLQPLPPRSIPQSAPASASWVRLLAEAADCAAAAALPYRRQERTIIPLPPRSGSKSGGGARRATAVRYEQTGWYLAHTVAPRLDWSSSDSGEGQAGDKGSRSRTLIFRGVRIVVVGFDSRRLHHFSIQNQILTWIRSDWIYTGSTSLRRSSAPISTGCQVRQGAPYRAISDLPVVRDAARVAVAHDLRQRSIIVSEA
jgi:hypothetical protein